MPVSATELKAHARELGFVRAGIAQATHLEREALHLRQWLARDFHGDMHYMANHAEERCDPRMEGILPEARSMIVLAAAYASARSQTHGPRPLQVARYAQGRDYHKVLKRRAWQLAHLLQQEGFHARVAVDTMPVFERAWAQRAGVGFVGKNCCLIVPGLGSYVFLAVIVSDAPLTADTPMASRCGRCRACLDMCPTDAFADAYQLDARRCIAYLTIEKRGAIAPELRSGIGSWAFGCDICQEVCPFNHTAHQADCLEAFAPDPRWTDADAADALGMGEEAFAQYAQGSPIKRARREGFARNVAIGLGNTGDKRYLPLLHQSACNDDSAVVRESAAWACAQLSATPPTR